MKLVCALLLGGMLLSPLASQADNDRLKGLRGLRSGDMLRVVADSLGPVAGRFSRLAPDSLYLGRYPYHFERIPTRQLNYKPINQLMQYRPLPGDLAVELDEVSYVYKRGNRAGTGAIVGGLLGAGTFLIMGAAISSTEHHPDNTGDIAKAAIIGGILGSAVGAWVGTIFPTWKEIYRR